MDSDEKTNWPLLLLGLALSAAGLVTRYYARHRPSKWSSFIPFVLVDTAFWFLTSYVRAVVAGFVLGILVLPDLLIRYWTGKQLDDPSSPPES